MKQQCFSSPCRRLLLSSAILAALSSPVYAGSCNETNDNIWICSGSANAETDSRQLLNGAYTISTTEGFGLDTSLNSVSAIEMSNGYTSGQDVNFLDDYASTIKSKLYGIIFIRNSDAMEGDLSAVTNGIIDAGSRGINLENHVGSVFITSTGTVYGGSTGSVIDGGATSEATYSGIWGGTYSAGANVTILANNVTGSSFGIWSSNNNDGSTTRITTTGTVTGQLTSGIGLNAGQEVYLVIENGSTVQGLLNAIQIGSGYGDAADDYSSLVDINNAGTIRNLSQLSSDSAITGDFNANFNIDNSGLLQGTVQLGNDGSVLTNQSSGIWNTAGGSNDFGSLEASNRVDNQGMIIAADGSDADSLQTTTFNHVGTFTNTGILTMGNGRAGDVTIIDGNYVGNGGRLILDTVLEGDDSATDKLVINGNTAGLTFVTVNNAGGLGAATLEGIQIIQVNGTSDGEFTNDARIVAGAFDYTLDRGTGSNASNWYLSSRLSPIDPEDPEYPITPDDPFDPNNPMLERPEAGAYIANLAASNTMFATRLHDRLGETQYIDVLTGEQKVTSMWLRNEGGHNRFRDNNGQLRTQANRYVLQLGGDIAQWSNNGLDRFHLGLMAGYGNSQSHTVSRLSGYNAKGSVDGYSVGAYGTWYANQADKSGLYLDGWLQYNWFNNTVTGQSLASEDYKSKGMTASVETGYTFNLGENVTKNYRYFVQPKAQVTWMGVKADDHHEANGTLVKGEGDGNIQTRLGIKGFINGYSDQDQGKDRVFQPFVEANWIHNSKDFGANMNDLSVKQAGAGNIGELKVGVEGQLNKQLNLWGNITQQVGNKGYSDTAAMLGVKYNF